MMGRAIVLLFIAGVAGVMAYVVYTGECPTGKVVTSEENCRSEQGLSAELCRTVFARALDVARNAGTVYNDPQQCSVAFGPCLEHATVASAWVPRPHGFCVNQDGSGRLASMTPTYQRSGVR
jgi:uncharacterized protein YgiB involved in biofilm formation